MRIGVKFAGRPSPDLGPGRRPPLTKDSAMTDAIDGFKFGLEAEFLVVQADTFAPLWHDQLDFFLLHDALAAIKTDDLPGTLVGLDSEPAHRTVMPYVIEGYHMPAEGLLQERILPKGVEIRTPVCASIPECLTVYRALLGRMRSALATLGYRVAAISHHPTQDRFEGPQHHRRHDFWQWAMEAMTTYGPDINISVPESVWNRTDTRDLEAKINHYSPAMACVSTASPFVSGAPWSYLGQGGKSFRMHKRSYIAPSVEIHPKEGFRLEYKDFDMPSRVEDFEAYFCLFLGMILSQDLKGRGSRQTRIYELGRVAREGMMAPGMMSRLCEVLSLARASLDEWGFDSAPLNTIEERLATGLTPADEMLKVYNDQGTITDVMKYLDKKVEEQLL